VVRIRGLLGNGVVDPGKRRGIGVKGEKGHPSQTNDQSRNKERYSMRRGTTSADEREGEGLKRDKTEEIRGGIPAWV